MGPSGSGKTTLLSILGMLDAAWVGEYELLGQPIHLMKAKQRALVAKANVGFVFQAYHLLDSLTVAENLDLPLSYKDSGRPTARPWWPTPSTASHRRQEGPLPVAALRRPAAAGRGGPAR